MTLPLEFTTDAIRGWRVWSIVQYAFHGGGSEPRLKQLYGDKLWPPRERLEAECTGGRVGEGVEGPVHQPPLAACSCGIHALTDRQAALGMVASEGANALGLVRLWGRTIEHKRGWRAQFAYPEHLWIYGGGEKLAEDLSRVYAVPADVAREPLPPRAEIKLMVSGGFLPGAFIGSLRKAMAIPPISISALWPTRARLDYASPGDGQILHELEKDDATGLVVSKIGWLPPTDADVVTRIYPRGTSA